MSEFEDKPDKEKLLSVLKEIVPRSGLLYSESFHKYFYLK